MLVHLTSIHLISVIQIQLALEGNGTTGRKETNFSNTVTRAPGGEALGQPLEKVPSMIYGRSIPGTPPGLTC